MKGSYYRSRVAWVIGGSQGIGRAVAGELSRHGSRVILSARRSEPLERAGRELDCAVLPMDVVDPESVAGAFGALRETAVPDLVLNCAGAAEPGRFEDLPLAAYRRMMDLNYFGTLHVCKAVLPEMVRRGRGHLVNTASLAGLIGLFGYTAYGPSKFAVVGLSEALRREVRPSGVRVSVLCPSNTRTPGLELENRAKPPEVLAQEQKVATLEPGHVARALLRALPRDPFLIFASWDGHLAFLLRRYAPWLLDLVLRRPPGRVAALRPETPRSREREHPL